MDPMIVAGAIACLGLSAAGSAFGTGFAASAAVGAWKKCYAANKPAPFILLGLYHGIGLERIRLHSCFHQCM